MGPRVYMLDAQYEEVCAMSSPLQFLSTALFFQLQLPLHPGSPVA